MKEHEAVIKARRNSDVGVLIACLGIIMTGIMAIFVIGLIIAMVTQSHGSEEGGLFDFIAQSLGWIFIAILLLVVGLVAVRMMRQQFLGNMLQIEYSDYAWLRDWVNTVSADIGLPRVEIFVTQDPVMNAYSLGFMRPYNIVLHSGTIRYLTHDEIKAVVLHEMGHVKYHHTVIGAYTQVFRSLPIIGGVCSWILDFWGRRTELTADRLAFCYLKDPELVKMALIKVHVGPDVAKGFNGVARQWQAHNAMNWFNSFTQTFSDHPFLVRRLKHLDDCMSLIQMPSQIPPASPETTVVQ